MAGRGGEAEAITKRWEERMLAKETKKEATTKKGSGVRINAQNAIRLITDSRFFFLITFSSFLSLPFTCREALLLSPPQDIQTGSPPPTPDVIYCQ